MGVPVYGTRKNNKTATVTQVPYTKVSPANGLQTTTGRSSPLRDPVINLYCPVV